jgi:hypothetical protein
MEIPFYAFLYVQHEDHRIEAVGMDDGGGTAF